MNAAAVIPTFSRPQDLTPLLAIFTETDPYETVQKQLRCGNLVLQGNNPSRLNIRRGSDVTARLELDFGDVQSGANEVQVRFGRNTIPSNIRFQLYQAATVAHELNSQAPGQTGYLASTLCRQGQGLLVGGTAMTGSTSSLLAFEVQTVAAAKVSKPWPSLTTTQRDALTFANVPKGSAIWNSTTNKLNVAGASAWEAVTSA